MSARKYNFYVETMGECPLNTQLLKNVVDSIYICCLHCTNYIDTSLDIVFSKANFLAIINDHSSIPQNLPFYFFSILLLSYL